MGGRQHGGVLQPDNDVGGDTGGFVINEHEENGNNDERDGLGESTGHTVVRVEFAVTLSPRPHAADLSVQSYSLLLVILSSFLAGIIESLEMSLSPRDVGVVVDIVGQDLHLY